MCFARRVLGTAILLVCFVPVSEVAGAEEPGGGGAWSYAREMRYLDTNDDRVIDAQELARGQQMAVMMLSLSWADCDTDEDGRIGPAEFSAAADSAMQDLVAAEEEEQAELAAEEALARAVPLDILLSQLGQDDEYEAEIAALREELHDLEDEEAVVAHITTYPTHYPRLSPVVRTWVRHYPVRPGLRKVVKPHPVYRHRAGVKGKGVKPPHAGPQAGLARPPKGGPKAGDRKPPKAGPKGGAGKPPKGGKGKTPKRGGRPPR